MSWWFNALFVFLAFAGMEGIAWMTHKYIMHGILWRVHKDHHQPYENKIFQHNDLFFLVFAVPAVVCLYLGMDDIGPLFWVGTGVTLYGIAYFLVHDLFIHQRIRFFRNVRSRYLRAIRKAHKVHHKHLDRGQGECFGMLWAPLKYFKNE